METELTHYLRAGAFSSTFEFPAESEVHGENHQECTVSARHSTAFELFEHHCDHNCPEHEEIARYYAEAGNNPRSRECADARAMVHLRERHFYRHHSAK
jgi:hypothetical protein